MNNHAITIQKVSFHSDSASSEDYQAECSCGWVSHRSWLKATARRFAHNHLAAAISPTV